MNGAVDIVLKWRMRPLIWYAQAEPVEHAISVLTPRDCHGCRANGVFEDQIPPDDPGNQFPHRRIRISVGASSHWNHGSEFRVTQAGKRATEPRHDKGKNDGWAGAIRDSRRGANKQAGPNDCADAKRHQVYRPERALQSVLANLAPFLH